MTTAPRSPEEGRPRQIKVALAGNPNSGKSTIFNELTGSRQHIGNYPGVTVEKKEGRFRVDEWEVTVIDLPGTYSLTAHTAEERIARNVVLEEDVDLVVDVVDASNLERNLYLATQFMELGIPLVLAFNMSDMAEARGYAIDTDRLAQLLNVTIVNTVGHKRKGIEELRAAILEVAARPRENRPTQIHYGPQLETELAELVPMLEAAPEVVRRMPARWAAVKLVEQDEAVQRTVRERADNGEAILERARKAVRHLAGDFRESPEALVADYRYGFISGACQDSVQRTVESRHDMSDRIDAVLTNRFVGLPIFLLLTYVLFKITFALGDPPMRWLEALFGWLAATVSGFWPAGSESLLKSLLVDGVIGGVGGVLVFLPNILLLFFGIALLEGTGYMARAAFLMDRFMHRIGLHGKSFIPMLIGFGCSVPGILATRTLETPRERLITMLVLPLMSCGARLVIYTLFIPAFFPTQWRAPVLFSLYLVGILLAVGVAMLLRMSLFRGELTPFVLELPPYRAPTVRGLVIHMWERGWMYVRKAGTLILAASVILWALTTFPQKPASEYEVDYARQLEAAQRQGDTERVENLRHERMQEDVLYTVAGRVGQGIEPALRPLGFDWRIGTALIGAFAAKEIFVAQLGIVFASGGDVDPDSLRDKLSRAYDPLTAYCVMLFCLISMPCVATIAVTVRESGSWKWGVFQLGGLTVLAYVVTLVAYQVGRLLLM